MAGFFNIYLFSRNNTNNTICKLDFDVGFDVDAGNDENTISLQQNFIIGVEKSSGQLKCLEWLPYLDSL